MHNDDYRASVYWGLILRSPENLRQLVLNFLENQGIRVLYQTTDLVPLRVVRCGTPERFSESQPRKFWEASRQ